MPPLDDHPLRYALMDRLEAIWEAEANNDELLQLEEEARTRMQAEGSARIAALAARRALSRKLAKLGIDPASDRALALRKELAERYAVDTDFADDLHAGDNNGLERADAQANFNYAALEQDDDDDLDVEVEYVRD